MPSRTGENIAFTLENYAYIDGAGRETMAFLRTFEFPNRKFAEVDSTMVGSRFESTVIDYLGSAPDMSVRTHCWVDSDGALRMKSRAPRFLVRPLAPRLPVLASATTAAREWWDEENQRHCIEVDVRNPVLGRLLYYRGWFTAVAKPCPATTIPDRAYPSRLITRE